MASPFRSKKTIDLEAGGMRVSRIRRDPPPPPPRKVSAGELRESESRIVIVGIVAFGFALFVALIGFSQWAGWTPRQYTIEFRDDRVADR